MTIPASETSMPKAIAQVSGSSNMIQAQIMELIKDLSKEYELSMIMISHDLSVLAELCDQIAIMYAGKVVEYGDAKAVFRSPKHPYTVRLMNSFPDIHGKGPLSTESRAIRRA